MFAIKVICLSFKKNTILFMNSTPNPGILGHKSKTFVWYLCAGNYKRVMIKKIKESINKLLDISCIREFITIEMNVLIIMKVCFLHIQCNPNQNPTRIFFQKSRNQFLNLYCKLQRDQNSQHDLKKKTQSQMIPITLFQDLL